MAEEHEHVKILKELGEQFQPLFQNSPDGVYLYIDEVHKICNEKLAKMFGLTVAEWEAMQDFVNKLIVDEDQDKIINSYHEHVHRKLTPDKVRFKGIRKDGSTFNGESDLVPFPWRGEMLALQFMREVK